MWQTIQANSPRLRSLQTLLLTHFARLLELCCVKLKKNYKGGVIYRHIPEAIERRLANQAWPRN